MPAASHDTAVRQTPFTDRLSPGRISAAMGVISRSLNPEGVGFTSATSPSASISPVNIPFYEDIGSENLSGNGTETWKRGGQPSETGGSQAMRRHVHLDAINDAEVPEGPMEHQATLYDHRRNSPGP